MESGRPPSETMDKPHSRRSRAAAAQNGRFAMSFRRSDEKRKTSSTNFEKDGHMRLARLRFVIVPVLFLFAAVAVFAQQNSEIIGTVTDQTGAVVPDANLSLTQALTPLPT
jgi:hypothetical protein